MKYHDEMNRHDETVSRHMLGVFVHSKIDHGYRSIMIQECPSCLNHILSTNVVQAPTPAAAEQIIQSSRAFQPIRLAPIRNTLSIHTSASASTPTSNPSYSHPPRLPALVPSLEAVQDKFDLATYYIDTDINSAANKLRQLLEAMCATFISASDRMKVFGKGLPHMCVELCKRLTTRVTQDANVTGAEEQFNVVLCTGCCSVDDMYSNDCSWLSSWLTRDV